MSTTLVQKGVKEPSGLSRSVRLFVAAIIAGFLALIPAMGTAHANTSADAQAMKNLSSQVYSSVSGTDYAVDGGGFTKGSQLLVKDANGTYNIDSAEFSKLSSKGQKNFANDVVAASNKAVDVGRTRKTGVTSETQANWFQELQKTPGMGSAILNETLKNTGPDFVTANRIYQPFAGPVSTVMGIGAILIMALIGIVIVADISYIVIPPVRLIVGDSESGAGKGASKLISHEAVSAVEDAEKGGSDGKNKSALGAYFKKRVISLIILGIALTYLISGQIYVLVGMILDLLRGFIGF